MKRDDKHSYLAAGLTAFAVIAASLCLFFLLFHLRAVTGFLNTLGVILRPIFMGMVIAFLLLPIHRRILRFLTAITSDKQKEDRRSLPFLNLVSAVFSLTAAFFLVCSTWYLARTSAPEPYRVSSVRQPAAEEKIIQRS